MNYYGDITAGSTISWFFNTRKADGSPVTLAGSPTLAAYKGTGTTEGADGLTLTVDFDSVTGLHCVEVDTSDDNTFYAAGNDYKIVLVGGTVDGLSVDGVCVGTFSIENRTRKAQVVSVATDAIDAASLKADAVAKIQSGLSTFDHSTDKVTVATNEDKSGYGLADGAITSGKFGSGAITSATFAAGALDAVWSASSRTLTSFGSLVSDVATAVWAATTRTLSAFSFTVQLDSSQPDYAPAKAGDKMDLVDSPNGDAITAIQSGLSTFNPASDTVKLDATQSAYAPAKAGDAMTLTSAYDAAKDAASQSSVDAVKVVTDKLDEMIETDSNGDFLFTALALSNAPTGSGGGGDATAANQLTIIGHLEDIKGATFDGVTDSLEAIRNRGDSAWITATGFATPTNVTNAVSAIESYGDANWATATGFATASDVTDAVDALKSYGDLNWVTATGFATADALQEAKSAIDAIPTSKEGYKLAADGLALVVPTDPGTDEPVFGTSSIVTWIGFFGAVSLNKATVNSDTGKATIRNSSDTADLVSYSISDDGTEFVMGPAE